MPVVAIALGSNLGDRRAHLEWAAEQLTSVLINPRVSSLVETDPFDVPDPQPPYLNGAVVGETHQTPRDILAWLLALEQRRGRRRPSFRAPRTLDLDLIFFGEQIISEPDLVVPHARFRERTFVLGPLAEIAPAMMDPETGKTVAELLAAITA